LDAGTRIKVNDWEGERVIERGTAGEGKNCGGERKRKWEWGAGVQREGMGYILSLYWYLLTLGSEMKLKRKEKVSHTRMLSAFLFQKNARALLFLALPYHSFTFSLTVSSLLNSIH
jgi:hypothetical protein